MKTLDFRSDTVTQPTTEMRAAMMTAPLGDDVFGDDPSINELQEYCAQLFGFEAALFAPSGTQTNLIALMSHCGRGDEALVGQQWHTYRWEAGGMAVLGSIQPQPIENQADGTIRIDDLQAAIKPDDAHFAKTKLVVIENTTGGKVLPLSYLEQVGQFAEKNKLALHLDGARLMNAAVALANNTTANRSNANNQATGAEQKNSTSTIADLSACIAIAKQIVAPFHSVSLCLSKGLGAPVGSLLLGSKDLITKGKRHRKMLGGAMRQAGFLAAAGTYALKNNVARLAHDHNNANLLAQGLSTIPFIKIASVQTNIVFLDVENSVADKFAAHLKQHQVLHTGIAKQRWVTHLDVDQESVVRAIEVARSFKA
jgi:threonine aldolase